MSKILAVSPLVLLLAACATPTSLRQEGPARVFDSTKDAKTVAMCIADRWENGGIFGTTTPTSMRETPTGFSVAMRCSENTCLLADVEPNKPNGSKTYFYRNTFVGADSFMNLAQGCQ